jgi:hypothetical protein
LFALLASPALAQVDPTPGSLHTAPFPGFASGNGKITNLAMGTGYDSALNVAIQTDGKILLAGVCAHETAIMVAGLFARAVSCPISGPPVAIVFLSNAMAR